MRPASRVAQPTAIAASRSTMAFPVMVRVLKNRGLVDPSAPTLGMAQHNADRVPKDGQSSCFALNFRSSLFIPASRNLLDLSFYLCQCAYGQRPELYTIPPGLLREVKCLVRGPNEGRDTDSVRSVGDCDSQAARDVQRLAF